jgi:GNAT superfamily N-acetyltransferase
MLVVEQGGRIVGGALAFRKARKGGQGATLRVISLEPSARGLGLGRRLMQTLEIAAIRLGIVAINLGGAAGEIKNFYTHMGYTGRRSMMSKGLSWSSRFLEARLGRAACDRP